MFANKARACPVKYLSSAYLLGKLQALLAKIKLGWKGLPRTKI